MRQTAAYLLILAFAFTACKTEEKQKETTKENHPGATMTDSLFKIRTGVNVSHWLSQSDKRGEERRAYITKSDFDSIKAMGFDHVRIPIDEEQMWDARENKETEAFQLLHNAITWALEADLRVIVDLHIIRSHYFNAESNTLWTDPAAQQRLIDMWMELSDELIKYPCDKLAYEIMNEAVAEDPDDWNELLAKAIAAIREKEPERIIVVGSNMWQITATFPDLKIPEGERNIILSFHFYSPSALTHHTASWTPIAEYDGPVNYPGWIVDTSCYAELSEEAVATMQAHANGYFDKAVLEEIMKPAITYAREIDLPLYCGEYGIYPTIPEKLALKWYSDVCSIFNENGIAYCHWAYKGDFPVVKEDGSRKKELVAALTAE